jgi:hypothetical protein
VTGNNGLDVNEIDSNAEEDEPLELYDAEEQVEEQVEEQGAQDEVSSEDAVGSAHLAIFHRNRFSRRSAHPHIAASLSVRKKVSIASTSRRISSKEGRHSGIGENI